MAVGTPSGQLARWEWRTFGVPDRRFFGAFRQFPLRFPGAGIASENDLYILIRKPSPLCLKVRLGHSVGLKIKRLFQRSRTGAELWGVEPAPQMLPGDAVSSAHASLGGDSEWWHRLAPLGLSFARSITTECVGLALVRKHRQTRCVGEYASVEYARITEVVVDGRRAEDCANITSIAFESYREVDPLSREQREAALRELSIAVDSLAWALGSMRPMNYLEAIESWSAPRVVGTA